jgi:opacity protein-like surface antigen
MLLKHAAFGAATLALCGAAALAPAAAQPLNCPDMYNQVMEVYRTAPLSLEYSQIAADYSASCLRGASAAPAYTAPSYGYAPANYPDYGYDYSSGDRATVGVRLGSDSSGGFDRDDLDRHTDPGMMRR